VPSPARRPDSVYRRARREWDDRYAHLARGKRNWQLACLALLAANVVLASTLGGLATRSHITPYVVEVDRLGQAVAIGPAERLEEVDERLLRYQLGLYVRDLRTVIADEAAQQEILERAYDHTRGEAVAFLDRHFQDHNPFETARHHRVQVAVRSLLPLSESSWQVQWSETVLRVSGSVGDTTHWQAIFTVEIDPPRSAEAALRNPLGLYVTEIRWTQTL